MRLPPAPARLVLAAALLVACGGGPPGQRELDLRSRAGEVRSWAESSEIDLGNGRDPALVGGWSTPSAADAGYLWGAGGGSELEFRRADARAFRIHLRGWAHPRLPGGQEAILSINDQPLGAVRLGTEPTVVSIEVPSGVVRPGRNRLSFSYPVVVPTGRFGRLFGPAWDRIRFDSARSGSDAAATIGEDGILLPAATALDFVEELPGGTVLHLAGIDEPAGLRLAIDVSREGEEPRFDLPTRRSWGNRAIVLGGAPTAKTICRVTLRAVPATSAGGTLSGSAPVRIRSAALRLPFAAAKRRKTQDAAPQAAAPIRPSFVVYLVDALRADRLGPYGAVRPATPGLDRFAAQATLFEQARAQSSWTRPTVATLFTGLTPLGHGATGTTSRLPATVRTLGARLRGAGYRTAYVTANGNTSQAFGFDQGIDDFLWLSGTAPEEKVPWPTVHRAAFAMLDAIDPEVPFLLVVHTVETHAPHRPAPAERARWAAGADPALGERSVLVTLPARPPSPGEVSQVAALYDAEVASADAGFDRFLSELGRRRSMAGISVVFLSDHGEELFDHGGVEHGRNLYEEQLRIPLLWSLPGAPGGRRIATPIDQLDFLPTILALAGLPADPTLPGRSFAPALRGAEPPPERSSAAWLDRLAFHAEAVSFDGWKLVRDLRPRAHAESVEESLFHLAEDATEGSPLPARTNLRAAFLRARLRGWAARSGAAVDRESAAIDESLRRELEALGYLD
ncbi:MAG: sulfatase [Thermoanaerobaculia bacterium]